MAYKISGLDPADFAHLVNLSDDQLAAQGAVRLRADADPGYPCRVTLFDTAGMMRDAVLVDPGAADPAVRKLFADPSIHHVDAHHAARGCFAARIERD